MIEVRSDEATLLDLGATNGTYVDGQRIDRMELSNRAEFTVGSTTLMFIVAATRETA
jgi:pSer/pThr/pTyr-binding forkhead associated (FHA) protein